ncbi:MAG: hypothetical protein GXX93_10015 [Anaerolineae bacterium]|nr:hypothetical protein [Anaerolineae bacterium]
MTEGSFDSLIYGGARMTARQAERIGITVSCVVALFLVSPLLVEVRLDIPLEAFGSPLHIGISRELLVGVLAGAISWAGAQSLYVLHPEYQPGVRVYSHCILPAMTAVVATVFWQRQTGIPVEGRLVLAASLGLLLSLVMLGQYAALTGDSAGAIRLRTILSVLSLATAFYLWTVLYATRVRSLLATPGAFLIAAALAIDLLQYEAASEWRTVRAALVIGLVVAECAWALNFGRLSPLEAGFFLLMVSYVTVGLARRHFQGALTWRAVGEHGLMVLLLYLVMRRFGF